MMRGLLLIKDIEIQNANSLSSPYTVGFPAMTAWLGFVHALQRHLQKIELAEIKFKAIGVVCNAIRMKTFSEKYENRLTMSKNPPSTRIDKKLITGEKAGSKAFIPGVTCDLKISLLIEHKVIQKNEADALCEAVKAILPTMRIAGGDILQFDEEIKSEVIDENDESELRGVTRQLMPGYFIRERRDLMLAAMQEGQDALDALLSYLVVANKCEQDDSGDVTWKREKRAPGWLVPIATGFHGITELGKVKGQRDIETPHRFAEAVVTLGEFVMPYRAKRLDDMLWHYHVDLENNLYLCQQK